MQVREEPYSTGGEEYLTFSHCTLNNGGAMDAKSGVFSASVPGQGTKIIMRAGNEASRSLKFYNHREIPCY